MKKWSAFGTLLIIVLLLTACNHGVDKGKENRTIPPELKLFSMTVHNQPVENKMVTVSKETITADDIAAFFTYGNKKERIPVVVKGGTFQVDKTKPTKIELSVNAIEGKHSDWKDEIEVAYKAEIKLKDSIILNINNRLSKQVIPGDTLLPDDFIANLTNGNTPELELPNSLIMFSLIFLDSAAEEKDTAVKDVEIDINGNKKTHTLFKPDPNYNFWKMEYETRFKDKTEPLVFTVSINPRDKSKHEKIVYKFKLTTKGIMEVGIGYNGKLHINNTEEALDTDVLELLVQSFMDIIKTVTIKVGEEQTYNPEVKKYKTQAGVDFWRADQKLLIGDKPTVYTITVTPKDDKLYHNTVFTYKLKGTAALEDNAEFDIFSNGDPYVGGELVFKQGCQSKFINSYGVEKVNAIAKTVSSKAAVHWKLINPLTKKTVENAGGITVEGKLTSDNLGTHNGEIILLKDKPSYVLFYVIAQDGSKDTAKGQFMLPLNEVKLHYDINEENLETEKKRRTAAEAFGTVEIEKEEVENNNNKFFLAITYTAEKWGVKLADSFTQLPGFKNLDEKAYRQACQITVDAAELISGSKNELDLDIPFLRTKDDDSKPITPPIPSFTYKVKIKLKS